MTELLFAHPPAYVLAHTRSRGSRSSQAIRTCGPLQRTEGLGVDVQRSEPSIITYPDEARGGYDCSFPIDESSALRAGRLCYDPPAFDFSPW